jgi:UDP-2-acetamido-3-amino-2,3-dideoxy-glucuronate N-acetyltransferase
MLGVPARRKGWACECGELLPETLVCAKCSRKYRETDDGLEEVR